MRGIWRVRKALDWLERTTGSEPDPEPVVALIEPPPKPAAAALPQGLWMPKFQPWAYVVVPKSACTTAGQYTTTTTIFIGFATDYTRLG